MRIRIVYLGTSVKHKHLPRKASSGRLPFAGKCGVVCEIFVLLLFCPNLKPYRVKRRRL